MDVLDLGHAHEAPIAVDLAHGPRHAAVRRQRITQHIARGGELRRVRVGATAQMVGQPLIRHRTVEVVRVHHHERAGHPGTRGEHCMPGPPGLSPSRGHRVSRWQRIDLLEREADGQRVPERALHTPPKRVFQLGPDDRNDAREPGAPRIVDPVVEERLTAGPNGLQLLESAVAAADARGEHDQSQLHGSIVTPTTRKFHGPVRERG